MARSQPRYASQTGAITIVTRRSRPRTRTRSRTAASSRMYAAAVAERSASRRRRLNVSPGEPYHDIGKLAIQEQILQPGRSA